MSLRDILQALGPAVPRPSLREALRGGLGAIFGLGVSGLLLLSVPMDLASGLYLIAPFAATSALLFVLPNSPLAQPWSAIIGNSLAAVVAVAVCLLISDPLARVVLSVGGALSLTMLARAMHPAAAAVAMTVALNPQIAAEQGFWFAIFPVGLGTALLVGLAVIYARLSGRRYPFRQFGDPGSHPRHERLPLARMGVSEADLSALLERYRQSFNLGVADLARLVGAVQLQLAAQQGPMRLAQDIMSRDLVTLGPQAPRAAVAEMFLTHGFSALPVVDDAGRYLGMIVQLGLIGSIRDKTGRAEACAREMMAVDLPQIAAQTPLAVVLPLLAQGAIEALPVVEEGRLVGILTRSDLIVSLARSACQIAEARALAPTGQTAKAG